MSELNKVVAGEEVNANHIKGYIIKDLTADLTDATIEGIALGGQVGFELNRSREIKEISHKDLKAVKQSASKSTWDFSMDGMYIANDQCYTDIEDAMASEDGKVGIYIEVGTTRYVGFAILTTNNLSAPYDDQLTYSIAGTGTGELHRVKKDQVVRIANIAK